MDVSVIVPTRNRSALLATTLRSALRQRGVTIEVLVIDDASSDGTSGVLKNIDDVRVRPLRHEAPLGVSAARNTGVAAARGDWLAFLDDDDLWAPDKLERQLQAAEDSSRDWVYTGAVVINTHGRMLRPQVPLPPDEMVRILPRHNAIPGGGSNVAMRRRTWRDTGPFDVRLRSAEDWEFCIRLAKHGPPAWVPRPLIAKRLHDANATLDTSEIVRGVKLVEALHGAKADWGRLHRWMAHCDLRSGRRGAALVLFARAVLGGQARAVGSDFAAIVRGFRSGQSNGKEPAANPSVNAWMADAAVWLDEFRESAMDLAHEQSAERSGHTAAAREGRRTGGE
jgi:glycosyltransferase involved in cell wall biosynthesis